RRSAREPRAQWVRFWRLVVQPREGRQSSTVLSTVSAAVEAVLSAAPAAASLRGPDGPARCPHDRRQIARFQGFARASPCCPRSARFPRAGAAPPTVRL